MRWSWLFIGALMVVGCEESPGRGERRAEPSAPTTAATTTAATTTAATTTATSAPVTTSPPVVRPELRKDEVTVTGQRDLVVTARQLVATIAPSDRVGMQLSFSTPGGLSAKGGLGAEKLRWVETFDALEVTVKGPDGATRRLKAAGSNPRPDAAPLAWVARRILYVGDELADDTGRLSAPWAKPAAAMFAEPGRYSVKLSGALELESGSLPFETGELVVEVKNDEGRTPLDAIEKAAEAQVVAKYPGAKPRRTLPPMEDADGNRVVRFAVSQPKEGYDVDFVEVVLSADGKVVSLVAESIFRCIAEGVAIATPAGPRPVEQLAIGDEVVAFDVERGERVVTRVQAVWSSYSERLIELVDGLVVSEHHPVYADAHFAEALSVEPGAALVGLDGAPAVAEPRAVTGGARVYDLAVGWPHTYFAGNVLVHNKIAESQGARMMREDLDFRPKLGAR